MTGRKMFGALDQLPLPEAGYNQPILDIINTNNNKLSCSI
jgi:hypothetical protein